MACLLQQTMPPPVSQNLRFDPQSAGQARRHFRAERTPQAMQILRVLIIPIACMALPPSPVAAQTSTRSRLPVQEIVRRAMVAEHSTNVRGKERSFIEPPGLPSVKIERSITRTKSGWTLYKWGGPRAQRGTITLDDGQWTRCYVPGSKVISTNRSSPEPRDPHSIARHARLLMRNYTVRMEGQELLAGRSCYVVTLTPKTDMCHAMKLWIDTKTFFTLGHQENTSRGHTVALTMFQWIEFPSEIKVGDIKNPFPAEAKPQKPTPVRVFSDIGSMRRAISSEICVPYSMPGGFEFERCEVIETGATQTVCLRYTDGWAGISIYQTRVQEARNTPPSELHFARHAMGDSAVDFATAAMNFMIIGRVEMNGLVCVVNALDDNRVRTYLADTARTYHVEPATLGSMRNQGLGIDTMNALLEISMRSRKPLTSLLPMIRDGYAWNDIAERLGVKAKAFAARVRFFENR
jgi:negative regulator of sigma E activity